MLGLVLIGLGLLFLLDNFGYIYINHIGRYWPGLFFIIIGLVKLSESDSTSHHGSGLGWIFLGAWFLISMNGIWDLSFRDSWPILIVGWGVSILWRALYRQEQIQTAEEHHHGA